MRQYRAERRAKMLGRFVGQLRRKRNRCEKGLVSEMTRRFGGIEGLARAWKSQYDAAAATKPGGKFASDTLFALLRLIAAYGRSEPAAQAGQIQSGRRGREGRLVGV
jgi:hypothetical protein